ncbi:MAG TPA: ferritin-like domain-containing protein, partial [Luteimonas sp.]|nr:ferritin-like domain-containing protein [Luteimonas sp.]
WTRVAQEEAYHFSLLSKHLQDLGYAYGDFDAHNGLWEMAEKTAHDGLARMALVPRVLEARGLDVTPAMIVKLRALGDEATATILETILREEVAHVAAGSRWFRWYCAREGADPCSRFRELLDDYARGSLRGPFNRQARLAAGFDTEEISMLERLG